jgi:hypothetical protein
MQRSAWLKFVLSGLLAVIALAGVILPVSALIGGNDVNLSVVGSAAPDIEVGGNGQFLAVTYFRKENENSVGKVYIKSSTATEGWLTSQLVGFGSNPQLAFSGNSNVVYVVWASNDNKAIQSARCTLDNSAPFTTPPACVLSTTDVQTSTTASLDFPDVVVDDSGRIHAVWVNNGQIQSRFTSDDSPAPENWQNVVSITGAGSDTKPVLAWSDDNSGRLHLAFLRSTTHVVYHFSGDSSHNWGGPAQTFSQGGSFAPNHDRFDNPTITAKDSNVFLAWDARRTGLSGADFSLLQATSTNNGTSFNATYAPSGGATNVSDPAELKVSLSYNETPGQEAALRPGLTISGTNAALVWQQIPDECANFSPATIHFASPIIGAGFDLLANDGDDDYMIDPDVAVSGSTSHIVYMRDADASCPGGLITEYLISYRGPFTETINDKGEGGGTFLPIMVKNN